MHQSVIDILYVCIIGDVEGQLHDDATGVNIVVEKEGCDTRLGLTVNHCPIDGSRTTVLGQQGGMDIERAILRHRPYHLGQHTEGNHHLKICLVGAQGLQEGRVFHLLRLKHRQTMFQTVLFDG